MEDQEAPGFNPFEDNDAGQQQENSNNNDDEMWQEQQPQQKDHDQQMPSWEPHNQDQNEGTPLPMNEGMIMPTENGTTGQQQHDDEQQEQPPYAMTPNENSDDGQHTMQNSFPPIQQQQQQQEQQSFTPTVNGNGNGSYNGHVNGKYAATYEQQSYDDGGNHNSAGNTLEQKQQQQGPDTPAVNGHATYNDNGQYAGTQQSYSGGNDDTTGNNMREQQEQAKEQQQHQSFAPTTNGTANGTYNIHDNGGQYPETEPYSGGGSNNDDFNAGNNMKEQQEQDFTPTVNGNDSSNGNYNNDNGGQYSATNQQQYGGGSNNDDTNAGKIMEQQVQEQNFTSTANGQDNGQYAATQENQQYGGKGDTTMVGNSMVQQQQQEQYNPTPLTTDNQHQQTETTVQSPTAAEGNVLNPVSQSSTPLSNDSNHIVPHQQQGQPQEAQREVHNDNDGAPPNDEYNDEYNDDDSVIEILSDDGGDNDPNKRPRLDQQQQQQPMIPAAASMPPSGAMASYHARSAALQDWMQHPATVAAAAPNPFLQAQGQQINPGQTVPGYNTTNPYLQPGMAYAPYANNVQQPYQPQPQQPLLAPNNINYNPAMTTAAYPSSSSMMMNQQPPIQFDTPKYLELPADFVPMWTNLIPPELVKPKKKSHKKAYELSLINLGEFTITGLPLYYQGAPTPISGLRPIIKRISREHGNAVFEKDAGGVGMGGRWKIPIGAYQALVGYLRADTDCVELRTIPEMQLKIASLGKARLEKDYPSAESLLFKGVPVALANALAPFQRGGVDFVLERKGRALIADEMGLGKTIQSVAAMAVYHKEWPLLVLTPSGARYHWENEFRNWLGVNGAASKKQAEEFSKFEESKPMSAESATAAGHDFELLEDSQINVLTSSKVDVLPPGTRIVICSYGLAPMLAENKAIQPGMFGCAIADESHMLKNSRSKRTQFLLPVLKACKRCILLSGTPALAKPGELWPQLQILTNDNHGFWDNESDFVDKYVKNGNSQRRAELHTLLTGTLMIRRLKDDILKDMPRKAREKAMVTIRSRELKAKLHECMELLQEGKGVMAKLARQHTAANPDESKQDDPHDEPPAAASKGEPKDDTNATTEAEDQHSLQLLLTGQRPPKHGTDNESLLEQEMVNQYSQRVHGVQQALQTTGLSPADTHSYFTQQTGEIYNDLQVKFRERMQSIRGVQSSDTTNGTNGQGKEDEAPTRATVLNQMYSLTGEAKVPAVTSFLKKWLADPAKGKICVFAHHIFMLDAIAKENRLSNSGDEGTYKFIRIDGKTNPRSRQEQINAFQTDPTVRIAILGITAAGVAVTLTAASQVLFAELFWTPAIMIQAEDRCHRIGQRARVHCKYMVAPGSLDSVLWRLIEKKFLELGEFVEGKEKLKMVVHKVYKNEEELYSIFDMDEDESEEDGDLQPDQIESAEDDVVPLDSDLQHDIEEFAREEEEELQRAQRARDDDEDEEGETDRVNVPQVASVPAEGPGRSEEEAIALDDSDDEEEVAASSRKAVDLENNGAVLNTAGSLPSCRIYKMTLRGPTLGVEVGICKGRVVVSKRLKSRLRRLGEDCKPHVGAILVAVDNYVMPPQIDKLDRVLEYLKSILNRPQAATLYFAEDPEFAQFYTKNYGDSNRQKRPRKPPPAPADDLVVELLDDD